MLWKYTIFIHFSNDFRHLERKDCLSHFETWIQTCRPCMLPYKKSPHFADECTTLKSHIQERRGQLTTNKPLPGSCTLSKQFSRSQMFSARNVTVSELTQRHWNACSHRLCLFCASVWCQSLILATGSDAMELLRVVTEYSWHLAAGEKESSLLNNQDWILF